LGEFQDGNHNKEGFDQEPNIFSRKKGRGLDAIGSTVGWAYLLK